MLSMQSTIKSGLPSKSSGILDFWSSVSQISTSMFGLIFSKYSFMTSTFEKPASFLSANACLVDLWKSFKGWGTYRF